MQASTVVRNLFSFYFRPFVIHTLSGEDIDYLSDEAHFVECLARDEEANEVELDPWQRCYIRDTAPYIITNKSRQTGWSWIESAKSLARSHTIPNYAKYFVSINLDESKTKIRYVRQMFDSLPQRFKLKVITDAKTEFGVVDRKGRVSIVKALTSRQPRGMHGDIALDEFAHYLNPRKIFDAAGALVLRGGQFTVGSSPMAKQGQFFEICDNSIKVEDGTLKYGHWRMYEIPWWMSRHLCVDVPTAVRLAPGMTTRERVMKFGSEKIKGTFASYSLDAFIQECECGFMDEQSAFMPLSLIQSCAEPSYAASFDDGDEDTSVRLLCRIAEYTGDELYTSGIEKIVELFHWLRGTRRGMIEGGFDVGRHHDISALVVTDTTDDDRKEVRLILGLDRVPFDVQEAILSKFVAIVTPHALRIDKGGIGEMLAERLAAQWQSIVEPISFTAVSKASMAQAVKVRFESKKIKIPYWQKLITHINSIRKSVTAANNLVYEADANDHHGDYYWSLALTEYRNGQPAAQHYEAPVFGRQRRISSRTPID